MADYLLTGATGWLGKRVLKALTQGLDFPAGNFTQQKKLEKGGHNVTCLVQSAEDVPAIEAHGAKAVIGDVTDTDSLLTFMQGQEGAILLHCAGLIHPTLWTRDFYRINMQGTQNVINTAATLNIGRIVIVSSNSPIGCNPQPDHVFTEESPYNPYMGYGRSKMKMEQFVRQCMTTPGYPELVIVRPPWFYGPDQPLRQSTFFQMVREGKFPLMGAGQNRRSLGYVDSLAYGLLLAAQQPQAAGEIYWLADAKPYAMLEIIDTIKAVMSEDFGLKVAEKNLHVPAIISDGAYLADRVLQGAGVYHQKIHVLSEMNKTIACSINKAQEELGYHPLYDLRQGMHHSIKWCLDHGQQV